jgi:NADH-quinone oxidoreductase subunit C
VSLAAIERLRAQFGDAVYRTHSLHGDDTAVVDPAHVLEIVRFLRDTGELGFDQLIDLTVVDTLGLDARTIKAIGGSTKDGDPTAKRFHVVYHFRSTRSGKRVRIKAAVDEGEGGESPEIDSLAALYKAANWAEREAWDMYGVKFRGHPDLRRILMYEEFIGHPLRKDYPKEKRQPLVRREWT